MRRGIANPWLVVAAALVLLAVINVGYRLIVGDLRDALDDQLGEQLGGLAETFAAAVDPEAVRGTVGDNEFFEAVSFLRLREQARQFAAANRLVSATVLDSSWRDPFAAGDDSLAQIVYSLLDRESGWAIHSGLVWVSPTYRWEDSYYRSAAAPIEDDSTGELIAIARIEADARHFASLDRLGKLAWWMHALSALLASALIVLFLLYAKATRRWESELLRSEKLIGLGRLSATIAHEIKNPLGIIKASAQRLQRLNETNADNEKRAELVRFIPEEVDRLNRVLSRYLAVGETDVSHPVAVDVARELSEWVETAGGKGRVEVAISTTAPVLADRESPRQVVINVVKNALEASPDGAHVSVSWESDRTRHGVLRVTDRGPGVAKRMRAEVFEPFYTTKASGSGLGLYAVKTLVERDGGSVKIEDNPGGGAVFVVRWRLVNDPRGG